MPLSYDRRAGQYRDDRGQFVGAATVDRELNQLARRLAVRMQAQTRLLIADKLSLPEWQIESARLIKEAHIQAAMMAAGGKDRLSNRHYGTIGAEVKAQYKYLDKFAAKLAAGEMTPAQALRRSALYGKSLKISFAKSAQITRSGDGANAGKRLLDAQAKHCPECIGHQRLDWVPIDDITPPGTNCTCQNNCRCRVIYRFVDPKILNRSGILG